MAILWALYLSEDKLDDFCIIFIFVDNPTLQILNSCILWAASSGVSFILIYVHQLGTGRCTQKTKPI